MGSAELGANIFRITQTESLLEKQIEHNEQIATNTHYKIGKTVRKTIGWNNAEKFANVRKIYKRIRM